MLDPGKDIARTYTFSAKSNPAFVGNGQSKLYLFARIPENVFLNESNVLGLLDCDINLLY